MARTHDRKFFQALSCPNPVTWGDIKGYFTPVDIDHMKKIRGIDLGKYEDVMMYAVSIYNLVSDGSMPPPGSGEAAWSQAQVDAFGCWIKQNCPK